MARYDRKDHYHQRAKREGYLSRAAYKLEEIQARAKLLRRGQRVVDLGCWPGGWLQVASQIVGREGRVVGVDNAAVEAVFEIGNVFAIQGDFTEVPVMEEILAKLKRPADVIISDAAPKLTGIRNTDRALEEALLEGIEATLETLLLPGGDLLVKLLECPEAHEFEVRMRKRFGKAKALKTKATRKGSNERYLLGRGYRPETLDG
jgi:23S rRNA (uridine2552-2'-O)-methyltransferase